MKHVLVVDDQRASREYARILLEAAGFSVSTACDGLDALLKIEASPPDRVLFDIEMACMDGYELAQAVRRDGRFDHIPLIALTAHGDSEAALAAGFDALFTKPPAPQLCMQLSTYIEARTLRQAS